MMDLTRLMFDDGATRPAEQEDTATVHGFPVVVFEFEGALWEGRRWLLGDPWPGYGWNFSNFYPIQEFLDDPVTYASTHWAQHFDGRDDLVKSWPGWERSEGPPNSDGSDNPLMVAVYCFSKL